MKLKTIIFSLIAITCYFNSSMAQTTTLKTKFGSIDIPQDWTSEVKEETGEFVVFIPGTDEKFRSNFTLIKQTNVDKSIDLAKYGQMTKDQLDQYFAGLDILSAKLIGSGKTAYYSISYSGLYKDDRLNWKQVIYLYKNTAYIYTFTTKPELFEELVKSVDQVFSTIKIKGIH
ncbi:MAG: hypothetical protein R2799_13445 [Crocinitomicaceae bacterium]